MKVRITKEAKTWLTVARMPVARQIVKDYKDYDVNEDITEAVKIISGYYSTPTILDYSAEIAGNIRCHDRLYDGSGDMDIWVMATVFVDGSPAEFMQIGFYITDMWDYGYERENREYMKEKMFIRRFKEVK